MSENNRAYTTKNGYTFTIEPMTQQLTLKVTRALNKKNTGFRVSGIDTDLERNIEFKIALAKGCCSSIAKDDGSVMGTNEKDSHIEQSSGCADYIVVKARELDKELAEVYEDEEKNS